MKTIQIDQMKEVIKEAPVNMNLLFIGDTGIGKTQGIQQYCDETGAYLKTLILSTLEPSECLGVPVQSKKVYNGKDYDVLSTAIPTWVFDLKEHEDNAILFLDEFLCANPEVMNSFLNFLTEKKVQDIDLSKVKVVSATNIGDYTNELDENMLSRFCMFKVENSNFQDYLENKYDKVIIDNTYTCQNNNYYENKVFEPRSLKPRCQETLMQMDYTSDKIAWFYEGFTNRIMPIIKPKRPIIFIKGSNKKSNRFFENEMIFNKDTGEWQIDETKITALAEHLKIYFDKPNYKNIINTKLTYELNRDLTNEMKSVITRIFDTLTMKLDNKYSNFVSPF